jgi:hypothetical protein
VSALTLARRTAGFPPWPRPRPRAAMSAFTASPAVPDLPLGLRESAQMRRPPPRSAMSGSRRFATFDQSGRTSPQGRYYLFTAGRTNGRYLRETDLWTLDFSLGYMPVTASPLHSRSELFARVPICSRSAQSPVSCILVSLGERFLSDAKSINTLKSRFLNLGSEVQVLSGTPISTQLKVDGDAPE